VADHAARTPAGLALIIELAETLQAPVIDESGRMNFPSRHALNHSENRRKIVGNADVILGLEVTDFYGTVHSYRDQLTRGSRSLIKKDVKLISITANDLYLKSNYQTFQRYTELDLAMAADAEATLPSLIDANGARFWLESAEPLLIERMQMLHTGGMPVLSALPDCARKYGAKSKTKTGRWFPMS
jgi:hypothetical protein